tara:strand:+ start:318 stop:473 length:156 start_codon:yes stop_codon:yes gene_type:complete
MDMITPLAKTDPTVVNLTGLSTKTIAYTKNIRILNCLGLKMMVVSTGLKNE